jgi:small subunit ribosomal protein S1
MDNVNPENKADSPEDFSEMVKDYGLRSLDTNSAIEGRIVEINDNKVVIDIGQKAEGILDKEEILDWNGALKYKIGDSIRVQPKNVNFKEGYITVTKKQLDQAEGWENVMSHFRKNIPIKGVIIRLTPDEKGFIVDCGAELFLPMSQVDMIKVKAPLKLLGMEYEFKITKISVKDKSGTLSRRILQEDEKKEKMQQLLESLQPGQIIKGQVTSVVDYGAFVDIGGIEGLVHRDNISYGRITHPKEKLKKSDEIEVKILDIDKARGKISLGIKQKFPDPWVDIEQKFPVGKRLIARVTKIVEFGAFIELEEGVEGLLHISDLTWEGRPKTVDEYVAVGDKLWVQVIEVSGEAKKIKLGLKQLEMRPEEKYLQAHRMGEVVHGKIKKILKSRVFVGLEEDVEGAVKISDISYYRIETPEEYLTEGEEMDFMIIADELDKNYKVQLGIKQLTGHEWKEFQHKHKPGNIIQVIVKKLTDKGIVVEVTRNIEGFVRLSDFEEQKDEQKAEPAIPMDHYKVGEKYDALIMRTEADKRKVYLSFRAVSRVREREEIEKYMKGGDDSRTTIGDLLQNVLDKKK